MPYPQSLILLTKGQVSADPALQFMELYDRLDDGAFRGSRVAEEWFGQAEVLRLARDSSRSVLAQGALDPAEVKRIVDRDGQRGIFALLIGLDKAFAHVSPYEATHDHAALGELATRHARLARLNADDQDGALLFACAFPGRPVGRLAKAQCFAVVRVSKQDWEGVELERIPTLNDIISQPDITLPVGCVPMVGTIEELVVERVELPQSAGYRLGARDCGALRSRIATVLENLDRSGVVIGILPEATLSKDLLGQWLDALLQTPPSPESRLKWVLIGSGPVAGDEPPVNRAVLVDRDTAEILWTQDKLSDFTLTADQIDDWKLRDHIGPGPLVEDHDPGTHLRVRESAIGRAAVLICEDLARPLDVGSDIRALGVSHLFVPVFSKPLEPFSWDANAAALFVFNLGSWVIVANSRAVGILQSKTTFGTARAIGPDPARSGWKPLDRIVKSSAPEDVCILTVGAGVGRRWSDWEGCASPGA